MIMPYLDWNNGFTIICLFALPVLFWLHERHSR